MAFRAASSKRQFILRVTGPNWPDNDTWADRTGGEKESQTTRAYDGGQKIPSLVTGPAEVSDLVLTRPYRADRDGPLLASVRPQIGALQVTITSTATDPDLVSVGQTESYTGLLTKVKGPEVDANDRTGAIALVEVTFGIVDVA